MSSAIEKSKRIDSALIGGVIGAIIGVLYCYICVVFLYTSNRSVKSNKNFQVSRASYKCIKTNELEIED